VFLAGEARQKHPIPLPAGLDDEIPLDPDRVSGRKRCGYLQTMALEDLKAVFCQQIILGGRA
jgi:hypothetical protein